MTSKETRDSQTKRLSTSVWVDVHDVLPGAVEALGAQGALHPVCDDLVDKTLWFTVFVDGRCYTPLPHWKAVRVHVIRHHGGVVELRRTDAELLASLQRNDRPTRLGVTLRGAVQARFDEGFSDEF